MRITLPIAALALILAAPGSSSGATRNTTQAIKGETLDPAFYGASYVESMEAAIERDRLAPPAKNTKGRRDANGTWVLPSRGAITFRHSGEHYAVNKWGDTRMGIAFPEVVDVHGAYFAGQAGDGAWTTGLRAFGYRAGALVRRTEWFTQITAEPRWFAMDLEGVDRIVIVSIPVLEGGGWYGMDDLTYAVARESDDEPGERIVVNFDDLSYRYVLTGSGYAGLTWETGTGDFSEGDGIHGPMIPPEAASNSPQTGGFPLEPMQGGMGTAPTLLNSFQGVIRGDATSMSYPPDTDGAVGPDHYVITVNRNFAVYDKDTGDELINILLGSFLPGSNGDPRVLFDHHSGRWIVLVTDFSAGANIYLAVSLTDDATGAWFKTSFLTAQGPDAGRWPDYPTLGVDANGIYTAAYMVSPGMSIFAVDKAPLIAASPSLGTVTAFRNLPFEGAIQPAHTYGTPQGEYFVSVAGSSSLRVRRVDPPMTSPTLVDLGTVSVPFFSDPPNAPALGSGTPLNTVGDRLMMSVYRDGSLWTCHTIAASGRAGCRWYELDAATPSLIQQGTVADTSLYYFFPAIMVNDLGHVAMGFTGSNSGQYAACYFTGRHATDPAGEMAPPEMYKEGTGAQNNVDGYGRNRWGDYSYTTLDPVDQRTFWTLQEYGHATDIWGTYVAVLTTGPNPPIAQNVEVSTAVSTPGMFALLVIDDGEPNPPSALTLTIASLPEHGELSDPGGGPITSVPYTLVNNGNQIDYAPVFEYAGPDSFTFQANDGGVPPEGGDSNIATVSITVGGPDWDPVAYDMIASTALSTPADITLWASDPNSDPLTTTIDSLPALGGLGDPGAGAIETVPYTLVGGGNVVTYTPPDDQYLQETFDFSVRDATVGSNTATVTVTVGGPLWDPVAQDMLWGTAISLPTDIELSASDPNGDPLTYFIESLPDVGGLSDPGAGVIASVPYTLVGGGNIATFTPPWGQTIQATFDFSVRDATAGSNVATVTVDVGVEHAIFSFLMDSDPSWGTTGQWAFGQPTGNGSRNPDPTSGYTGNNVLGYNLDGDYENNMPLRFLTTGPIDCTYVVNAELRFRRWLGVESSFFDQANIQISTNGLMWSNLWVHDGAAIEETSWTLRTFDISSIADNKPAVFIRWGMGPTDTTTTFSGWNLDDILIWGLDTTPVPLPCGEVTYIPGDVSLDGSVNGLDVQTMVQMLLNPAAAWSVEQLCAGDFTDDDAVTVADVDAFVLELLNPAP